MGLFDKQYEAMNTLRQNMAGLCPTDEPLIGVALANNKKTFSMDMYAIGITAARMVMVPVDRKYEPKEAPRWYTHADIVDSSVWGEGGGWRAALSTEAGYELRFKTADGEKFKFMTLGGWTMDKLNGPEWGQGLEAWADFLLASQN